MDRVELEDALVVRDRFRAIARDLLGDERHLGEELGAADGLCVAATIALVERRKLRPLLARREDLLESLERALRCPAAGRAFARGRAALARRRRASRRRGWPRAPRDRARRARIVPLGLAAGPPRRWPRRAPARARSSTKNRAGGPTATARSGTRQPRERRPRTPPGVGEFELLDVGEAPVERQPIAMSRGRRDEHLEHLGLTFRRAGLVVGVLEDGRRAARVSGTASSCSTTSIAPRLVRPRAQRALAGRERLRRACAAGRPGASRARPRVPRARRPRADRDRER